MGKSMSGNKVVTIPNMLSFLRILLIGPIIYLYSFADEHIWAIIILGISCLSDMADGKIARKFNMITDVGKALDAIADKLTQLALFICLLENYWQTAILFCVLAIKEIITGIVGLVYLRKSGKVWAAKWFGKMSTVLIDVSLIVMFAFKNLADWFVWTLVVLCVASMLFAFVWYMRHFNNLVSEIKEAPSQ